MRPRLLLLAAFVAALLAPNLVRAAGTTTIDFQAVPVGDSIAEQYAGQDVHFGTPQDFGLTAGNCPKPVAQTSGAISGVSARISRPTTELKGPDVSTAAQFDYERRSVSMNLKATAAPIPVTVEIRGISGALLESKDLTLPANSIVNVSFTRPNPEIVFVRIVGRDRDAADNAEVFLDDLSAPIEDVPPPPKFSIALLKPTTDIVEGSTAEVPVSVRRVNGSFGPVTLSAGFLPSGITGTLFTPNPVTGGNPSTLKITAASPLAGDRQLS